MTIKNIMKRLFAILLICLNPAFPQPLEPAKSNGAWVCGYSIDEFEKAITEAFTKKAKAEAADENLHVIVGFPEMEKWIEFKRQLNKIDEIWSYRTQHNDEKNLESTETNGFAAISNGRVVAYLDEIYLTTMKSKSI